MKTRIHSHFPPLRQGRLTCHRWRIYLPREAATRAFGPPRRSHEATLGVCRGSPCPRVADWCAVDILGDHGAVQRDLSRVHSPPNFVPTVDDALSRRTYGLCSIAAGATSALSMTWLRAKVRLTEVTANELAGFPETSDCLFTVTTGTTIGAGALTDAWRGRRTPPLWGDRGIDVLARVQSGGGWS
jgi:hypothetical protein